VSIRSLRAAVSFLTVLPVANADGSPGERLGRAYFPAIGALIGFSAGVAYVVSAGLTAPLLGAAVAVAVLAVMTGALHLDGLADSVDGLMAHGDATRRLEVMRDPRLGSYGVTAITVVLLLDVAAIASMSPIRALAGLVVAGALSRLATLGVITFVPYVRPAGLGVAAWDERHRGLDLAVGAASAAVVCLLDWKRALIALPLVALVSVTLAAVARRRVGGATGDICGAAAELCQLAVLLVFAVR
jgi:adenosylcobinamide-GDP ribazoletransferase